MTELAQQDCADLQRVTDDLVLLVKRLVRSVKNHNPDNRLADAAMDYLERNGLLGRPLRDGAAVLGALSAAQEPLGAEFEAVWDANKPALYEP